ncbi:hypothetical protein TRFO_01291 [Tritrichomonas foetus]|uniref:Uncharacterized protein n=1 Tax=Tritrichomonas foetus TaxID=1144522 RepID=A0A1J4KBU3_9EUKA|nr:hypothetical protein TRFO_01291 [Tritrichomonas foetus]|eukprot:OHT07164.1 hypothetical protein TRFO_01291 [Tritrichomonas foetus]
MSDNPFWKRRVLECLRHSNKVDLSGENIDDLGKLGTQKLMYSFDLSYVQISSLEGLKPQPNLKNFVADGSAISTLRNFSAIQSITSCSMKMTPISKENNFLVSLLLVAPKLTIVNGKLISQKTRDKVAIYPPEAARLVNAGWMAEYPCPPDDVMIELMKYYNIYEGEEEEEEEEEEAEFDNEITDNVASTNGIKPTQEANKSKKGILEQKTKPKPKEKGKASINFTKQQTVEPAPEKSLVEKVAEVLKRNGVDIDTSNLQQSVLNAIDALCAEREQQKRFAEMLNSDQSSDAFVLQNNNNDGPDVTLNIDDL